MKGQSIVLVAVGALLVAFCDGLAIGFEVDTPLDPFLGGLSKIKRQIIRRVKDLGSDDSFVNGSPIDQLNMLFAQPPPPPVALPQFNYPGQSLTTTDQRKIGLNQIPAPIAQAMDAQLMTFMNQGLGKRGIYPSLPGLRQVPGILQQLSQSLPFRSFPQQCPIQQQRQTYF